MYDWGMSGFCLANQIMQGYTQIPTNGFFARSLLGNNPIFVSSMPLRQLGDASQFRFLWKWEESSPQSVIDFSAVAYFFGKELNRET